jgi:hypothetical protein
MPALGTAVKELYIMSISLLPRCGLPAMLLNTQKSASKVHVVSYETARSGHRLDSGSPGRREQRILGKYTSIMG